MRAFAVVMDKGDEAAEELVRFARENGVTGAGLTAVGACREATVAYFDRVEMTYQDIPITEQTEVLSFVGNIAVQSNAGNDGSCSRSMSARGCARTLRPARSGCSATCTAAGRARPS